MPSALVAATIAPDGNTHILATYLREPSNSDKSYHKIDISLTADSNHLVENKNGFLFISFTREDIFLVPAVTGNLKFGINNPTFQGLKDLIVDLAFNTFSVFIIASGVDDSSVRFRQFPTEDGKPKDQNQSLSALKGHDHGIDQVVFHTVFELLRLWP